LICDDLLLHLISLRFDIIQNLQFIFDLLQFILSL
jgi:hypothetical protein